MRRSPSRGGTWSGRARGYFSFGVNPVWVIIIINLIIFIATLFAETGRYPLGDFYYTIIDKFTYYLGLIPYYFTERPWTIFTAMFIHAGLWHLFFNMITLFFFGSYLSQLVGSSWFAIVYFIGGIVGNLLYVLIGEEFLIVVGASGAIYAIAGALVVMVPNIRVALMGIVPMPLWVAILVVGVILSFLPGVAWQAHLGGLAVGLIAGYFFRRRRRYYYR
jgi:membrane associated rhomboid family serine protease